jgi:hypothetical protein
LDRNSKMYVMNMLGNAWYFEEKRGEWFLLHHKNVEKSSGKIASDHKLNVKGDSKNWCDYLKMLKKKLKLYLFGCNKWFWMTSQIP